MNATAAALLGGNESVQAFRHSIRQFVQRELLPRQPRWRQQHHPDDDVWPKCGDVGMLLPDVPAKYGGGDGTFAHEAVVLEELARAGIHFSSSIQSIVGHYLLSYGSEAQKHRWLPRMARGEISTAIAMTEPAAGSDLLGMKTVARREGDVYIINGSKTFITNGRRANLVCVAVKTDARTSGPRGMSLVMVETKDLAGYRVGNPLEKVGRHGQDTCELFFDDVRVPTSNLRGEAEGLGSLQMMEQLIYERISVALSAVVTAERAVELTSQYVKERLAYGKPLLELQNTRIKLAECKTEARIARTFIDDCIVKLMAGTLDAATAAMAKWWCTEREFQIVDACVQLHGGYGYMAEYPIAQMWADSRVERIFAGTNEILKELIARSL